MKKLFTLLALLIGLSASAQLGHYQNVETQKIIYKVGDIPDTICGHNIDSLISDLKNTTNSGGTVWDKTIWLVTSLPTKYDDKSLVNWKDTTILASLKGTVSTGTKHSMCTPTTRGFSFKNSDYINEGYIPANIFSSNSSCHFEAIQENFTGSSNFLFGSHESASETYQVVPRSTGNSCTIDFYNTTSGQGRKTLGSGTITDVKAYWFYNRNDAAYCEVVKNSTVWSYTTSGGSLPDSKNIYTGCRNNNGTAGNYRNKEVGIIAEMEGLTTTQRAEAYQCFVDHDLRMGDRMNPDINIVFDGNSLSKYLNHSYPRQALYYAWPNIHKYNNIAVPGQTTAQMLSDTSTNVWPLYSASYGKNIIVPYECRNHIYYGATAAQADSAYKTYCKRSKAKGYYVVAITPCISNYVGNTGRTQTQFNRAIDSVVQFIRNYWQTFADTLLYDSDTLVWKNYSQFPSDAAYNTWIDGKIANTTVFVDKTHRTVYGYGLLGKQLGIILKEIE